MGNFTFLCNHHLLPGTSSIDFAAKIGPFNDGMSPIGAFFGGFSYGNTHSRDSRLLGIQRLNGISSSVTLFFRKSLPRESNRAWLSRPACVRFSRISAVRKRGTNRLHNFLTPMSPRIFSTVLLLTFSLLNSSLGVSRLSFFTIFFKTSYFSSGISWGRPLFSSSNTLFLPEKNSLIQLLIVA